MGIYSLQTIKARCDICQEEYELAKYIIPNGGEFYKHGVPKGFQVMCGKLVCPKHEYVVLVDGKVLEEQKRITGEEK